MLVAAINAREHKSVGCLEACKDEWGGIDACMGAFGAGWIVQVELFTDAHCSHEQLKDDDKCKIDDRLEEHAIQETLQISIAGISSNQD